MTDGNSVFAAEGIPFIFDKFGFLGFGKDFEEDHPPDLPRSRTLPADDSVIAFPQDFREALALLVRSVETLRSHPTADTTSVV